MEANYKQRTAKSFEEYYQFYGYEISGLIASNFLPMIKSNYISNIKQKNNYLELVVEEAVL